VELEERILPGALNSGRRSLLKENRKAEARANGKAGSLNQLQRYFGGTNTLNEQPIPKEDGLRW
jgi:hypothetical protein